MINPNVWSPLRAGSAAVVGPALSLALLGVAACAEAPSAPPRAEKGAQRFEEAEPTMDGPVTDPLNRPSTATDKLGALDLSPKLVGSDYFGELCPPGSLSVDAAGDGSALTLNFAGGLGATEGGPEAEGSCKIRLSLKVPQGSSFGNVYLYQSGYLYSRGGRGSVSIDYSFAGENETQTVSKSFADSDGAFILYKVMDRVWSPSCDQSVELVDLMIDLKTRASGEAYLGIGAIDLGLSYVDGAKFMRCADRSIIQPPPSEEHEPCAGPPQHPCASGLECDVFDGPMGYDDLLTGVCVRRDEKLDAMPEYGPCNGLRQVGCQSGLVCRYESAAHAAIKVWSPGGQPAQLVGFCSPALGLDGDKCGGYPAIQCAPGHFCSPTTRNLCKAWTGALGSACEDGIADCKQGLVCQNQLCTEATANEGERCGGPLDIACGLWTMCDPERSVCVSTRGKLGSSCSSAVGCDEGLSCYQGFCRDSVEGLGGTACSVHEDCIAGFYCNANNICWRANSGKLRAPCEADATCYPGLACVAGYCAPEEPSDDRSTQADSSATGGDVSP